jgi:hypothetical protein
LLDAAFDLVMSVASGSVTDVEQIAATLATFVGLSPH